MQLCKFQQLIIFKVLCTCAYSIIASELVNYIEDSITVPAAAFLLGVISEMRTQRVLRETFRDASRNECRTLATLIFPTASRAPDRLEKARLVSCH